MNKNLQTESEARMVFEKRDEKNKLKRLNDHEKQLYFKNKYQNRRNKI